MIISMDYDGTFTADKQLWADFICVALGAGHSVTFVTSRKNNETNSDLEADAKTLGIPIVFCGDKPKADCFFADVWIDDMPLSIPSAAAMKMATFGQ